MIVNGECHNVYFWLIEENEDYIKLQTSGNVYLTITFPNNMIGAGPQPLFSTDEDETLVPTIELIDWRSDCGNDGCKYALVCESRDSKNQISIDETNHPVFMEINLEVYLEKVTDVEDPSIPSVLHISDSRIRLPVARVKEPKDSIIQCPDSSSAKLLFNGGCRTAEASHSFFEGGTLVSIESRPYVFLESLFFALPTDFEIGKVYEIPSTTVQKHFRFDFIISDGDGGFGGYEVYQPDEESKTFFVVDEVSSDSTYITGRVEAFLELEGGYTTFETYEFIHIEECQFRSELLEF